MAFPTSVNDQITDSVTQADVKTLGSAQAQAVRAAVEGVAAIVAARAGDRQNP